jgi:hypothetical protein
MLVVIGLSHGFESACAMVHGRPGGTRSPFCPRRWVFRCDPFLIADARAVAGTAGLIAGVRMQHRPAPYNDAQNQDGIHGFKRN